MPRRDESNDCDRKIGNHLPNVCTLLQVPPCAAGDDSANNSRRSVNRYRRNVGRWFRALFLACCAMLCVLRVAAATVSASIDRQMVPLGEIVTLSITFDGANVAQPNLPQIPGFELVGTGSSFNVDAVRGIAQQTFSYQLSTTRAGDFTIPGFRFNVGGQIQETQPIQVKVVQTQPGASPWFARIVVAKSQLYVGEMAEVQVHLYFQEGRITQYPQLSADSGFILGRRGPDAARNPWLKPVQTRANVSNQVFNVLIFKQPITPVKSGTLSLGPATLSLLIPDRARARDILSLFDRAEREVRVVADKTTIEVLPLPTDNVPPTFAGAVGNFTLGFSAGPTNLAAGDPITARIQIRGRGALESIQLPPQPTWNEFKTYPPTSQIEDTDPNNFIGTKTFEQVVVPERAGVTTLPPFTFSFFDPDQKTYQTLTGPQIALSVGAASGSGSALPSLPGGTNAAPAQPASDLAHIKPYLGTGVPRPLLLAQPWFLGVQLIPPVIWLGLLLNRKRRQRLANDPKLRRRYEVAHKVRLGLAELQSQATANNSETFFAIVLRLLQEQIGERVDVPPNAITEAVVEEKLRPAGASTELRSVVQELFQICNLARYAPVKSSEELSAVVPKVEKTLRELQRWEPSGL